METRNQELNKLEESLKSLLRKTVEKQSEKHDKEIQEMKEKQDRDIKGLRALLLNLQPADNVPTSSAMVNPVRAEKELSYLKPIRPKLTKLEFPKFNADHLYDWLFKCKQFFEFDETPGGIKVKIASLHLEGASLQWYQHYMRNKGEENSPNWEEYVTQLDTRFGSELHYDPMAELKDLRQTGSVHNYLIKFEELLNKIDLSDDHILSFFMCGLKEEIKDTIRLFRPANLQEAISLARIQEAAIDNAIRRGKSATKMGSTPLLPTSKKVEYNSTDKNIQNYRNVGPKPFRKLSSGELEEKKKKGLCYYCDEKYTAGHT
ncbi:Retrotransposon gag domain-containing protein [Dioscorea alata]|uniref:Retrotransposon gag domain-containing protein n=1 Tax=Dioscorea alata TaxID=55571 RepID=A0ACB7WU83_DIOAL|nr:Retrotransposon gag domain-containing protein [Dioscorea alata]